MKVLFDHLNRVGNILVSAFQFHPLRQENETTAVAKKRTRPSSGTASSYPRRRQKNHAEN